MKRILTQMPMIIFNPSEDILHLKYFDKSILNSSTKYHNWKLYLKDILKNYDVSIKSFSIDSLKHHRLNIFSDNINFENVKIQDEFLYSLATDLGFPRITLHLQESCSDTTVARYIRSDKYGENLQIWSDFEKINLESSETIEKIWELTTQLKKTIDPHHSKTNLPSTCFTFIMSKYGGTSVLFNHNREVFGDTQRVEEILKNVWDEARDFVESLHFLVPNISKIKLYIFPNSRKLSFTISLDSNKFIKSSFTANESFLGINREFKSFINIVSNASFKHIY